MSSAESRIYSGTEMERSVEGDGRAGRWVDTRNGSMGKLLCQYLNEGIAFERWRFGGRLVIAPTGNKRCRPLYDSSFRAVVTRGGDDASESSFVF
jgi:hypothetical protein